MILALAVMGGAAAYLARADQAISPRAAVALFLYGQVDPDHLAAPGLHGLGGRVVSIALRQDAPCRFTLATAGQIETIDFNRIFAIRHTVIPDPAAGLTDLLGGTAARDPMARRLTVAIVDGVDDAICAAGACKAERVFALAGPEFLDRARQTATEFLSRICPRRP